MSTIFDSTLIKSYGFELIMRLAIREEEEIFNGSFMKPTLQTSILNNSGVLYMGLNVVPILIFRINVKDGKEELKVRDVDYYGVKSKLDKFITTYKAMKGSIKKNKKYFDDYRKSVETIINGKVKHLNALNKTKDPSLKEEEIKYKEYVNKENKNIKELRDNLDGMKSKIKKLNIEYRHFYDPRDKTRFDNIKFESATIVDWSDPNREAMLEGFNIVINGLSLGVTEQFLFMLSDKLNKLDIDILAQNMFNTYLIMQNSNKVKEVKQDRRYQEKQHVLKEEMAKQKKMHMGNLNRKNEIRPGISHMSSSKPSTGVDDAFESLNSFNNKE